MDERVTARRRLLAVTVVLALGVVAAAGAAPRDAGASDAPLVPVIVQAHSGPGARAAVKASGGQLGVDLPIVGGFAARVPAPDVASLAADPAVSAVTPDETVRVLGHRGGVDETTATNIKHVLREETGASRLAAEGIDGTGQTVALIDTGITPSAALKDRIKTVDPDADTPECVNFSGESHCDDSFGHGTFLAGLIAGNGAGSDGRFAGVAPGAQLLSVKIAGHDGSADVSKVLAAIQWVVSFKAKYGITVLNLSLGTNSTRSYRHDPLNYAVEKAWDRGITVIVAAGNSGPGAGTVSKPGDDPLVITVGAVDDRETPAISDDRVPPFSSRGPTAANGLAKPDVVAPGGRVVSLNSIHSKIDEEVPGGDDGYRRGSGTSMSAAVVSGLVALILDDHSDDPVKWTPDQVKFALMGTAHKVNDSDPAAVGAGLVDAYAASRQAPADLPSQIDVPRSTGIGAAGETLDASRGTVRVRIPCADELQELLGQCGVIEGDETAQGGTWSAEEYTEKDWDDRTWETSQWVSVLGSSWHGSSWHATPTFEGSSWHGYGTAWEGSSWHGAWE